MFHTVLTLGNWGKSSNASRSSDPNQAPPLATLQTDRTTCARMMGTRGIENGGSKVIMQVDDHSVTELCARKKTNCNSCCKRLFARTDLFATHLKFTALMGVSCNLMVPAWCRQSHQMYWSSAGRWCNSMLQKALADGANCAILQLLFQSLKRCPGWGDVAIRSTIPSTHMHKSHYLPWCVLYMGVSTGRRRDDII